MTAMPQSFDPALEDTRAFRNALGLYATGVTVVTCQTPDGPLGMTVNSFTSLSLDPPLVLWCPAKDAGRHDAFVGTSHFAIHVLSSAQKDLCMQFAKSGNPFADLDWTPSAQGTPLLSGALARFECAHHAVHDGGDHSILVGRVETVTTQEGSPLIYHAGNFKD